MPEDTERVTVLKDDPTVIDEIVASGCRRPYRAHGRRPILDADRGSDILDHRDHRRAKVARPAGTT